MTTKHTPGPWMFIGYGQVITKSRPDRELLADIYGPYGDEDETEADACLIAAAPDLLAACEAWLSGETTWSTTKAYEMAARAVAKAKGETK